MSRFIENCPACSTLVQAVFVTEKKSGNWFIYDVGNFVAHRCAIAKDARRFLAETGWYNCRDCGRMIKCITRADKKKSIVGPSGARHKCDERKKHVDQRFWSGGSMEYPWEYPVIDGVPVTVVKEARIKAVRTPKVNPFVWRESDGKLLDEVFGNGQQ